MDETTTQSAETGRSDEATQSEEATQPDRETPVGVQPVPLEGESPLDGGDTAEAVRGHTAGVAATAEQLAAAVERGEADPSELAAARTEASELLALLRDLRV